MADQALIERTFEQITQENLNMGDWGIKGSCGTTMCFAGHAVTAAGYEIEWTPVYEDRWNEETRQWDEVIDHYSGAGTVDGHVVEWLAQELLDLTDGQAAQIFYATRIGNDVAALRALVAEVTSD